jgi:hypothetical protein
VFSVDDPYCGVDLDDCVTPQGEVKAWAQAIIDNLDTYAEISPSGTGVKLLVRATLPGKGLKKKHHDGEVEIYDRGRYFTLTGWHLKGTPESPQDAQEAVVNLIETVTPTPKLKRVRVDSTGLTADQVIEKAKAAKNADKFNALMGGDLSYNGYDESSVDLALCNLIGFYAGDQPDVIYEVITRSALMDEKWEREDYIDRTIEMAIKDLNSVWTPKDESRMTGSWDRENGHSKGSSSSHHLGVGDDDDDEPTVCIQSFAALTPRVGPRGYIVEDYVFEGLPSNFYGDGGASKSMNAIYMLGCVNRGDEWLGKKTTKSPTLFMDFELDAEEQASRMQQIANAHFEGERPENGYYMQCAGMSARLAFEIAHKFCIKHGVKLVAVDSLGVALSGDAEAARDVIGFFGDVEGAFRREGIALLLIDHMAHVREGENYGNKKAFGSVYKTNLVRSSIQIQFRSKDTEGMSITLRHQKCNVGPLQDPVGVKIVWGPDTVKFEVEDLSNEELATEPGMNSTHRLLLALEEGPMFPDDIAAATGIEVPTVRNILSKLRTRKKIEDTGVKSPTGAKQVRLSSSSSSHTPKGDDDDDGTIRLSSSSHTPKGWDDGTIESGDYDEL